MKFHGKLFLVLLLSCLITNSIYADKKQKKSSKTENINEASIIDSESITASTTYNNLPKEEIINTLYEDPLSDNFIGKSSVISDKERNRSTSDLLSEFEGQAQVINDNTEVPDNIVDEHTKEERLKIEAKADALLKEAAIRESKDNSGEALLNKEDKKDINDLNEKIQNLDKEDNDDEINIIEGDNKEEITSKVLYDEEKPEKTLESENKEGLEKAIIKEDWPNTEQDPEFVNNKSEKDKVEIIEIPEVQPEEIPNYENMQGIETVDNDDDSISEKKKRRGNKKDKNKKKKKEVNENKEDYVNLDPVLITDAKPKSIDDETQKEYSFTGILMPEKQPIGRGKNMLRWVLRLDDGTRIPLKSNLKLLQEVRKEKNLEDYVSISGKMRTSTYEKELKYLIPETIGKTSKKK